jgi:hypothetical protein
MLPLKETFYNALGPLRLDHWGESAALQSCPEQRERFVHFFAFIFFVQGLFVDFTDGLVVLANPELAVIVCSTFSSGMQWPVSAQPFYKMHFLHFMKLSHWLKYEGCTLVSVQLGANKLVILSFLQFEK